ncbi:MAG: YqaA family protein [Pseudomonadota bacterium]
MLRRLYDWTLDQAEKPYALWVLAAVAFVESSFFPIPPDILLIPMVLAALSRAWWIAFVCTVASVFGGAFGYLIGAELFDLIGEPILNIYNKGDYFAEFAERFNAQGHWAVLFAGMTPFPYKVITIASGVTGLPFGQFMLWSFIARGARFFIVAALLWYFGEPIKRFIERYLGLLFTLFCILLVGGFFVLRYL